MSMKQMYSLKDAKVCVFGRPFPAINDADAVRQLTASVNSDQPSNLQMFPEDFELYRIGTFNELSGIMESKVEFVVGANSLVNVGEKKEEKNAG